MDGARGKLLDALLSRVGMGDDLPPRFGGSFAESVSPREIPQAARATSDLSKALMPGIGDVVGPVQDAQMFLTDPESRTPLNYGLASLGALPFLPSLAAPIKAFHGSPHKFDRFDMSKIGTGEGAQVYGHGLYFAESPDVARSYQNAGTPPQMGTQEKLPGSFYHTKLDVEHEDLFDWDAPITKQPAKVKEGFRKAFLGDLAADPELAELYGDFDDLVSAGVLGMVPNAKGSAAYKTLADRLGSPDAASRAMKKAGIPGIRYLDGGSRADGKGTRNFVIFDDNFVDIEQVE